MGISGSDGSADEKIATQSGRGSDPTVNPASRQRDNAAAQPHRGGGGIDKHLRQSTTFLARIEGASSSRSNSLSHMLSERVLTTLQPNHIEHRGILPHQPYLPATPDKTLREATALCHHS